VGVRVLAAVDDSGIEGTPHSLGLEVLSHQASLPFPHLLMSRSFLSGDKVEWPADRDTADMGMD